MIKSTTLTLKNFFSYYIFNPKSPKLSVTDQKIATLSTWTLGVCSLGTIHGVIYCLRSAFSFFRVRITYSPKTKTIEKIAKERIGLKVQGPEQEQQKTCHVAKKTSSDAKQPHPIAKKLSSKLSFSSGKNNKKNSLLDVFNELIATEKKFSETLKIVATDGLQLFSDLETAGVISSEEKALLARGWEKLSKASEAFGKKLEEITSAKNKKVGNLKLIQSLSTAFSSSDSSSYLPPMATVITGHKKNLEIMTKTEKAEEGSKLLKAYQARHQKSIDSHMIQPVQRITRYKLLLEHALMEFEKLSWLEKRKKSKLKTQLASTLASIKETTQAINDCS